MSFENTIMVALGVGGVWGAVRGIRAFYNWAYWRGYNVAEDENNKVSKYTVKDLKNRVEDLENKRK